MILTTMDVVGKLTLSQLVARSTSTILAIREQLHADQGRNSSRVCREVGGQIFRAPAAERERISGAIVAVGGGTAELVAVRDLSSAPFFS